MKNFITPILAVGVLAACSQSTAPDLHTQMINDGEEHPLVILLGGSDGGNYFAVPEAYDLLNEYHTYGMSVASMGYFGTESTPSRPIELSLNEIDQRMKDLAKDPAVNESCVILLGFSKGAELALLLGSHFDTAQQVVAAYPTHVTWNATESPISNSGWTLNGEPLEYINAPILSYSMLSGMFTGEYIDAYQGALDDASPEEIEKASIPVENIGGPVTLVSAKADQVWPSHYMANQVKQRLEQKNFSHKVKHIALDGDHYSYNRETMAEVLTFVKDNLGPECN